MANAVLGEVGLEADGRHYTLILSFNAICAIEARFGGRPIGEIAKDLQAGSMQVLRGFLWAALQEKHPGVTLEEAGRIAQAAGIDVAGRALTEAQNLAWSKSEKSEGGERP